MQFCRDLVNVAKYAFLPGKKTKNKHMAAATKADKESVSLRILPHPAPDYESGVFSLHRQERQLPSTRRNCLKTEIT